MNIQAMMKQAQAMQKDLTKKKDEINSMVFEGISSMVDVKVNGKKEILSIDIRDKESIGIDDLEMLQDILVVAINDAFAKVDFEVEKKMGNMGGLGSLL